MYNAKTYVVCIRDKATTFYVAEGIRSCTRWFSMAHFFVHHAAAEEVAERLLWHGVPANVKAISASADKLVEIFDSKEREFNRAIESVYKEICEK